MRAALALAALSLAACLTDAAPAEQPPANQHAAADAQPRQQLVISHLELPTKPLQYDALGFDLDNDSRHAIDNKIGALMELIEANEGWQMQPVVDAQVTTGRSTLLVELRGLGAEEPRAVVRILLGRDADADATNNLAGTGSFTVDPSTPPDAALYGRVQDGVFRPSELGSVDIDLALTPDGNPIRFHLLAARVELRRDPVVPGLFHGKLGGGILASDFRQRIAPAMGQRLHDYVAANPGLGAAMSLVRLFDKDHDGSVSVDEVVQSNTLITLFSADVDLLRDSALPASVYGKDGSKECISVGLGFDAVPASF